ncbi:hypothetical protein GCM10011348_02830 [Marinobacterium nitratireducens]|uniref:Uncharacterized protein n=1 Tax=Marinobacterium nitratireducens TaxID=518897 RepID=A0A918DNZ6_9GAMM|nr:hypothetical protein [Marinobacterium nitratireducens]GGO76197.1 hypothetical protein GCM10011348_02830 [Marinobacterium nitratireducens]
MPFIVLHRPIASAPSLERLHLFAGRHLGEEEFDRQQAYADARLAPLLKSRPAGVVQGLRLGSSGAGGLADHDTFVVNPGLALTPQGQTLNLQTPLKAEWRSLIEHYLTRTATSDATGVYYLTLQQTLDTIDAPGVEPCQRAEFDPTRDSRLVAVTSVQLRRLAIAPEVVATTPPEQLQNWIAADRVDGEFLGAFNQAVPLALLAIESSGDDHSVSWVSEAAGRYEAVDGAGYRVLLNQVSAALRRTMQRYGEPGNADTPLQDFLGTDLHLDYLPAAGQLPVPWLQNPDAGAPGLLWLPQHLGIDMVPVPSDSVAELIARHLPRRVIDLRQGGGDNIRLLLAIDRRDYRPDLLDIPPTDTRLEADIYRFYMRAYNAWHRWRVQFDRLYFVEPSNEAPLTGPDGMPAIEHRVLDPAQFRHLDLPKPALPPIAPASLFGNVIGRALQALGSAASTAPPYPYDRGVPAQPDFYRNWLVTVDDVPVPPPVPVPDEDGLVIRYAVALVELEAIENQIRTVRSRLEKTRDLLLLMRQQLDSQTVALSSLAGGVAGDGNGLQVARWLPYASLNTNLIPEELSAATASVTAAAPVQRTAATAGTATPTTETATRLSKSFSSNLLTSALNTSISSTPTYLTTKPETYSAFELGINKQRLDLLANLGKSAVSKPAFDAKEFRFGVLDHISPEINEYRKAYFGMQDLVTTIQDLFDPTDASALRKKLKASEQSFGLVDPSRLEDEIDARARELAAGDSAKELRLRGLVASQKRYEALFNAGKVLTQWISIVEGRYNRIERKLQGKLREHTRKLAEIEKLSGLIRVARETLENLDRDFDEQLGDYGVAQRLLEEDWRQAHDANLERSRILTTALQGLFYVRVRETPVSVALADPLSLRHRGRNDIVPGCDGDTDASLPQELDSFFDAVCEIPMDDWASLRPLRPKLPPFDRYGYLGKLRQARFEARPKPSGLDSGTGTLQARLHNVQLQTRSVLQQWSRLSLPAFTASSLKTQQQAARVFSLEDLAQGGRGDLRKQAQTLRERLEQCQACLLEKLSLLPGSIRLQWGQLAEDDRIRVEQVGWWPGLERAEQDDFNATRTLAELIDWWFRQLSDDADAASRSAMRNMIRAALIFASLGDPREIVRGTVFVAPRVAQPGERFRVRLNRAVLPGVKLQLLDLDQQVAAELAVEDHSPDSTQVRIVNLVQPSLRIDSRFAVVGNLSR